MSRDAGVLRRREDLERLRRALGQARPAGARLDLATVEATSLHAVSVLVAASALARAESRGCHRWRDTPAARPAGQPSHTVLRVSAAEGRIARPVREKEGASP